MRLLLELSEEAAYELFRLDNCAHVLLPSQATDPALCRQYLHLGMPMGPTHT